MGYDIKVASILGDALDQAVIIYVGAFCVLVAKIKQIDNRFESHEGFIYI